MQERSVWQMPVACISTRTSSFWGPERRARRSSRGPLVDARMRASVVVVVVVVVVLAMMDHRRTLCRHLVRRHSALRTEQRLKRRSSRRQEDSGGSKPHTPSPPCGLLQEARHIPVHKCSSNCRRSLVPPDVNRLYLYLFRMDTTNLVTASPFISPRLPRAMTDVPSQYRVRRIQHAYRTESTSAIALHSSISSWSLCKLRPPRPIRTTSTRWGHFTHTVCQFQGTAPHSFPLNNHQPCPSRPLPTPSPPKMNSPSANQVLEESIEVAGVLLLCRERPIRNQSDLADTFGQTWAKF